MEVKGIRRGGSFLIEDVPAGEIFTPEDFGEEHRMIIKTTERFVKNEIAPRMEELEHKDFELNRRLMQKAGELGLLGVDVEEEYGGTHMDNIASQLVIENSAGAGSFGVTLNAHTGIGTMPLVFFGNRAQKQKYLPPLARGEKIGAYALTEPGAGTDALSIETTAILSPDGKYYTLNGTKQFITNGGFADIILTYAKVDGEKFTAFVVESGFEGVSVGAEEKKLGIRGTSTCSIFLDDARVPVENVVFEIGRGHVVAFNILNLGRFKLAAGSVGVAKLAMEGCVGYAKERVQFGRPICQFGMMKHKIAEMAVRTYMAESMVYRTGGLINTTLSKVDRSAEDVGRQSARSIEEYAIECSMNKVYCSEMLAYVADETVQIYGGYGYIEDYPAERIYRDCRIFRIFEGTNEINRVIVFGWLMRKALKNEIPFFPAVEKLKQELNSMEPLPANPDGGPLEYQHRLVDRAKKLFLFLSDLAAQKYGMDIEEEQELIGMLSDIAMEVYAMESGLLRALKSIETQGAGNSQMKISMAQVYINDTILRLSGIARHILSAMETGEVLQERLEIMHELLKYIPVNAVKLRRYIADEVIEVGRYTC